MYIHERDNWTNFRWDASEVSILQEIVCRKQGLLYGRLSSLGFDSKLRAMAENLTHDVVYSSENYEVSPEPSEPQVRTSTLYLSVSGVSRWWGQAVLSGGRIAQLVSVCRIML